LLAISFTLLLATNSVAPSLCAAHCSPAKTASHHHRQDSHSMCDDCSSTTPQLHAFTCSTTAQIDARTEPLFTLNTPQSATNSAMLKNSPAT